MVPFILLVMKNVPFQNFELTKHNLWLYQNVRGEIAPRQYVHIVDIQMCTTSNHASLVAEHLRTCDFQQCGILTSVDSDEPVQPPVKLRNSKCFSVISLTVIEHSSD